MIKPGNQFYMITSKHYDYSYCAPAMVSLVLQINCLDCKLIA